MERYICIHGHFYQPPRENPWLDEIERQESAYPFHDWNERITVECYAPNTAAPILGEHEDVVRVLNTYAWISFNMGPTLLSWLERKAPETYLAILEADRESQQRFDGHGSALAQCYNHMIMPLANRRDKYTQVSWGIRDFEYRFQRRPEGIWLPETAVDLETLEILAEQGITFTLLSPYQAARVRAPGEACWWDVTGARIDPTRPYIQRLPSGREIALFFYDGSASQGVAFEGLLHSGERFAQRLAGIFADYRDWPQLAHIATDGESYGHHHRHGEMALAYALHSIETHHLARITNYGEYLAKHPPSWEVDILENSSWSCAHGVGRWREDCGCSLGSPPDWNQAWRAPLRRALDWLRDEVAWHFEHLGCTWLQDPWAARDDYIQVVLDRSADSVGTFLQRHEVRPLDLHEIDQALKLLELQRQAMLMYTSCGWFFDDVSGIETVQILRYAGRVIQLAEGLFGENLEPTFLRMLRQARSNGSEYEHAQQVYEACVRSGMPELAPVPNKHAGLTSNA